VTIRLPHDPNQPSSLRELQHLRYALDQSVIVATTDVQGRITSVNDKFCQISKYSREELMGQDHRILNSGFHGADYIRDLWRTIAQGHVWRGELRNRAKDGSIYWVATTIVPFLDADQKPWQYMAIRYDITDRKLHEQRLRDQAALASLGEMAAVVAHEVRNPLAGIRGGVQLIGSMMPPGEDGRSLIREIIERIDALNRVVEDLLAFARQRDPRPSSIALAILLSDLAGSLRYDPAMEELVVTVTADEAATVEADLDQLRLVFTNLLMNAAQAMQGRGELSIDVTTDPSGRSVVRIADRGPGIPVENRERIFEPFFTTKSRGTGLGLPTSRRLIQLNGGLLDLLERPGGGTIAQVVFPSTAIRNI
jgi:PAS domain S-box-containing protein